jgi:hypothetical protein
MRTSLDDDTNAEEEASDDNAKLAAKSIRQNPVR